MTNIAFPKGIASEIIAKYIPAEAKAKKSKILFISVAIQMHFDWEQACTMNKKIGSLVQDSLDQDKFEIVTADEPFQDHIKLEKFLNKHSSEGLDGIILYHSAYTTGEVASTLGSWLQNRNIPLFSYAMPEPTGANLTANRLCSQNFVLGILNNLDVKYQWLFCQETDPRFNEHLLRFANVVNAISKLQGRKALIAGAGRVPGFYDCEVNELEVLKRFKIGFDRVNLVDITSKMGTFSQESILEIKSAILNHKDFGYNNVPDKQFDDSLRLALALMTFAREGNYIGISFKNWPELFDHFQIAGDGAMALVNDQNIPISDEADTGALISMLVLQQLKNDCIPSLADLSYLDDEKNIFALWHNGSASTRLLKQGSKFEARRHGILENFDLETAWGVCFEFLLQPGEITVLRYISPNSDKAMLFEGKIVESDMKFRGTYGEVIPDEYTASQILGTVMDKGLDHHWLVGRGHFKKDIQAFNYFLDIAEVEISNTGTNSGFGVKK